MSQDQDTILITGSNRGIGLEFVKQYIKQNWNVIATCRKPNEADELQSLEKSNENISLEDWNIAFNQNYMNSDFDSRIEGFDIFKDLLTIKDDTLTFVKRHLRRVRG